MKAWLIVVIALVAVGLIVFVAVMSEYRWDFTELNTGKFETSRYEINEEFNSLSMDTDTADIRFVLSDDKKCKVECYEEEKVRHTVTVRENVLVIEVVNNKSWYDYIGFNFSSPKLTVYLPKTEYATLSIKEHTGHIEIPSNFVFENVDISLSTGNVDTFASTSGLLKIKASTGKISVGNATVGELDLSTSTGEIAVSDVSCTGNIKLKVSTGKTNLTDIRCQNLTSDGDTGAISLNSVIATEKLTITRSTGDVKFNSSDAAEILVETDTGNVTGTLLTDKVFITHTDTGRVNVPETVSGGKCKITTDTGDIKLEIKHN